jgi:RNA polymerase sigma-70 factor (ECF subfamily)
MQSGGKRAVRSQIEYSGRLLLSDVKIRMAALRQELESVYDQYGHSLFACALAITGNANLAEDAVHDAFCRAFRLKRCPDNTSAYMFRSVRHAAIDIRRKNSRVLAWSLDTCRDRAAPETADRIESEEQLGQVLEAMLQLNDNEREIVMARLVGDTKFRDIAAARAQPLGTITALYHRGLAKLKKLVEKRDGSI